MDAVELLRGRRSIRFKKPGIEIDFGGLAKGYAAEAAARVALRTGAKSALVNLGGSSMYALAGIRDPSTSPNRQTFRAPHCVIEETKTRLGATHVVFLARQLPVNEVERCRCAIWHSQAEHCGRVPSLH
jgi:hypothetical protein